MSAWDTALARRLIKEHPEAIQLVEHYLDEHRPKPGKEDVTLPRAVFVSLCMVATVGLEAIDNLRGTS